jgi:ribulose-phosphate 3-epimerase
MITFLKKALDTFLSVVYNHKMSVKCGSGAGQPILAPSLLAADFCNLGESLLAIEQGGGSMIHLDVMDGAFVPQLSFGEPIVRAIRKQSRLPFDVHLMTERPETHLESFSAAGADWITFHWEAAVHHHRILERIHALGKKAGIAVVPSTPVAAIREILADVDIVLVMTVDPGFGGQRFIGNCLKKVTEVADLKRKTQGGFLVSVDGGVDESNLTAVIEAGADIIVSGSAFFSGTLNWRL